MSTTTTREREDRYELAASIADILETDFESMTRAAAPRDISVTTLRRRIERGEVKAVFVGRDILVWRDEQAGESA